MATPSYSTLVSGIVTRLREDVRLSDFNDTQIYYGAQPNVPFFPALTVELQEANDIWRTYPTNKDISARVLVTVIVRNMGSYVAGLQEVERHVKNIDDVFHTDPKISGVCYDSEVTTRRFSPGQINDIPVFACEMELQTMTRYTSRSV